MGLTNYKDKMYILLTNVSIKSCITEFHTGTCKEDPNIV